MQRQVLISRLILAVGLAALSIVWARQLTDAPIVGDAAHNLRMAINLVHHGTMSMSKSAPYEASMYREPLPVFFDAVAVKLVDAMQGTAHDSAYFVGERARLLKYMDVAWMLLLSLAMFATTSVLTSSIVMAFICMLTVSIKLPLVISGVVGLEFGFLRSELPTAALLVIGSILLSAGWTHGRSLWTVVAGIAFGMLALVKASFLYVFAGVIVIVIVTAAMQWGRTRDRNATLRGLLLLAGFTIVVAPWMYRNHVHFGTFSIAERGGGVLSIRVMKDQMTLEEYVGSFYVWAPHGLQPLIGAILGFSPDDLKRGGRLQRLNRRPTSDFYAEDELWEKAGRPDRVVSYYRKARAASRQFKNELMARGEDPAQSDAILQERSLRYIREHPWRHLALTIPFLWRGALFTFPVLAFTLWQAVRRRNWGLARFALPAFGLVMFYALFSHFIPRYGAPVFPVVIVCVAALLKDFLESRGPRQSRVRLKPEAADA
jgi:4-amino-4-deoxy-L-arabinose transferase-like glycosyltransferase